MGVVRRVQEGDVIGKETSWIVLHVWVAVSALMHGEDWLVYVMTLLAAASAVMESVQAYLKRRIEGG